jgi:hypothetical protein
MSWNCSTHGDEKIMQIFVRKPRCKRKDNIKIDLKEIEYKGVDWIDLVHDSVQWTCSNSLSKNSPPFVSI